jgi:hypothetical protein
MDPGRIINPNHESQHFWFCRHGRGLGDVGIVYPDRCCEIRLSPPISQCDIALGTLAGCQRRCGGFLRLIRSDDSWSQELIELRKFCHDLANPKSSKIVL